MWSHSNGQCRFGRYVLSAAAGALGLIACNAAQATSVSVPVGNFSFESPALVTATTGVNSGGYQTSEQYTVQSAVGGGHAVADPIPYWTVSEPAGNSHGSPSVPDSYGVDNPINSKFAGTSGTSATQIDGLLPPTADGYQNAYVNFTAATTPYTAVFTYDPNDTATAGATPMPLGNFTPGDTYTLTVAIGNRLDKTFWSYGLTLTENGTPVGAMTTGQTTSNSGTFFDATYNFTAGASDTGAIGIQIDTTDGMAVGATKSNGTQASFDNVRLSYASAATPEPASLLLIIPMLGLLALRRRGAMA
ncbi:MAG: hypothetical protein M0Z50_05845 [Planctomycetia bacterium]|nr:hypothetical protein [Planctomycetia bacterium]